MIIYDDFFSLELSRLGQQDEAEKQSASSSASKVETEINLIFFHNLKKSYSMISKFLWVRYCSYCLLFLKVLKEKSIKIHFIRYHPPPPPLTYTLTHRHMQTHTHSQTHADTHMQTHTHSQTHADTHSLTDTCRHTHRHTHADTHTDTDACRHTHTHIHRRMQTHTHIPTHTEWGPRTGLTHWLAYLSKGSRANMSSSTLTNSSQRDSAISLHY